MWGGMEAVATELGHREVHPGAGAVLLDDDLERSQAEGLSIVLTQEHGGAAADGVRLAHGLVPLGAVELPCMPED